MRSVKFLTLLNKYRRNQPEEHFWPLGQFSGVTCHRCLRSSLLETLTVWKHASKTAFKRRHGRLQVRLGFRVARPSFRGEERGTCQAAARGCSSKGLAPRSSRCTAGIAFKMLPRVLVTRSQPDAQVDPSPAAAPPTLSSRAPPTPVLARDCPAVRPR